MNNITEVSAVFYNNEINQYIESYQCIEDATNVDECSDSNDSLAI